jgi:hypothetical protein
MHRDGVRGNEVYASGLQADPVGDGPEHPGSRRGYGLMHPPARALHRVQVMLDDFRGHLRDLDLFMGGGCPQVGGGQVRAARARPPAREMRHRPIRVLAPGQVRALPPGCLPGFRFPRLPRCGFPSGGVRPGWSSIDGGSEDLPEFRDAGRSSLARRFSSSATRSASAAFWAASITMSWPCSAISASRAASSGLAVTGHHLPAIPSVIKTTR